MTYDLPSLAIGLVSIAIGLLALVRTQQMNDVHNAIVRLGISQPRTTLGLRTTRLLGALFLTVGLVLIVAAFVIPN